MRIMIDTNIIVSAVLFPQSKPRIIVNDILKNHILVISSYSLVELEVVFKNKFFKYKDVLDEFLLSNTYECYKISTSINREGIPYIRDKKDYPVLASFIESGADILKTGDKDFFTPELNGYNICTPDCYYRKFMKNISEER